MIKKILTVTVAVSALNEEYNIANFIQSVLKQKQEGFVLKKILIVSDGSTDHTVQIVRAFKNNIIEVKEHKNREGKATRLNQIYNLLDTDILIENDADVMYGHEFVIRDIVTAFQKDSKIMMCGGDIQPYNPKSFLERAILDSLEVYQRISYQMQKGDNIHTAQGRILAYRKEFIKKVAFPKNTIGTDAFAYLACKYAGYKYQFVKSAKVYFQFPITLQDHIKQNTRYMKTEDNLKNYFPETFIKKEGNIPGKLLFTETMRQFFRHPVTCFCIFLINRYCSLRGRFLKKTVSGKWDVSVTSKEMKYV